MSTHINTLSHDELELISGGNYHTWLMNHSDPSSSGGGSTTVPTPGSNTLNMYGNGNAGLIVVQNVVLINSILSIDLTQYN